MVSFIFKQKMLIDQFKDDWFLNPSYWFHATSIDDEYLKQNYIDLLDVPVEYTLSHLIIQDQLIRHIERKCLSNHIIEYHLQTALNIHQHIDPNQLSNLEWCFWALPVRHSKDIPSILKLVQDAWKRLIHTNDDHLKRFIKASYQRMPMNQTHLITYHSTPISFELLQSYHSILDNCPTHPPTDSSSLESIFKTFTQTHPPPYLMSLSGGVDSMVCSYVLKKLNISFEAIHINYCNRDSKERDFVIAWCGFLKIPLYVRNMTEIQRQPCMDFDMRNIYESYTRNVRYECYRTLTKKGMVFLGHNQDDCFENILTNLCHQHKYNQLTGMSEVSQVDGIMFGRPLLNISKATIYEEANRLNIPYLKDSTPSWSQRGQIRDMVRPALEKWDARMVPALFQLSNQLTELSNYRDFMFTQLKDQTAYIPNGFTLKNPTFQIGYDLWKHYLHSQGILIKHKSLNHFMEHIGSNHSCMLTKEWKVCFKDFKWLFTRTSF